MQRPLPQVARTPLGAWLVAAILCLWSGRAEAQTERTLLLLSVPEDAAQRIRGQVADLPWVLQQSGQTPAQARVDLRTGRAAAALWLTSGEQGALTLHLQSSDADEPSARVFPLQTPADALAESAQLEALAVAVRGQLKGLTLAPPPPPPRPKPARKRPLRLPAPPPPADPAPPPAPMPEPEPAPAAAPVAPPQEPASPPSPVDDATPWRVEVDLAYGLRLQQPLPAQHDVRLAVALRLPALPLRLGLGATLAVPTHTDVGSSTLRLSRWEAFVHAWMPWPWGTHVTLGPAVEAGLIRHARRTESSDLNATDSQVQFAAVLRGLATLELLPWPDAAPSLRLVAAAGLEFQPHTPTYREQTAAGAEDVPLAHLSFVAHLGLRLQF